MALLWIMLISKWYNLIKFSKNFQKALRKWFFSRICKRHKECYQCGKRDSGMECIPEETGYRFSATFDAVTGRPNVECSKSWFKFLKVNPHAVGMDPWVNFHLSNNENTHYHSEIIDCLMIKDYNLIIHRLRLHP